jgi:hypothetical protein
MEMNDNDKYKSPDSESLWNMDAEASAGKKFTIPKIRRTTEKGDISIEETFFKNSVSLVRLF